MAIYYLILEQWIIVSMDETLFVNKEFFITIYIETSYNSSDQIVQPVRFIYRIYLNIYVAPVKIYCHIFRFQKKLLLDAII